MTYACVSKLAIFGSDSDNENSHIFIQENAFENVVCKMVGILSRLQYFKEFIYRDNVFI